MAKKCKNCNGCRALFVSKCHGTCELGYPIRKEREWGTLLGQKVELEGYYPAVDCPKPRTIKAFFDAPRYDGV